MKLHPIQITAACWIALGVYWTVKALNTKRPVAVGQNPWVGRISNLSLRLSFLLFYLPLNKVPVLGSRIIPRSVWLNVVGAAMCIVGVGFAIGARHFLAGNWSAAVMLKENHALIQTGPYALGRHPIYSGFLFAMAGTAVVIGELRAVLALFSGFGIWRKLLQEEDLMRKAFPNEYPAYERRVRRLVPGIL